MSPVSTPRRSAYGAEEALRVLRDVPISSGDITDMLHSLTEAKLSLTTIMATSDVTAPRRRTAEICLETYHEKFHAVSTAYLQLLAKFETVVACGALFDHQARRLEDAIRAQPAAAALGGRTFAEAVAGDGPAQIRYPNGPTVTLPRCPENRVIIEPREADAARFATGEATRQALQGSVDPVALGITISHVSRVRNNGLRVHARDGDLQRLKDLDSIREAGLQVKDDVKLNPRLRLGNVPVAMSRDAIVANLVALNLQGCNAEGTRVVYVYPAAGRRFTRCVIETSAENRKRLLALPSISLGWNTCYVEDHIRVLQCFRCCNFGHIAAECRHDPRCSRCAGPHETRGCSAFEQPPVCANCRAAKLPVTGHAATDAVDCPILRRRISEKARLVNYG